MTEDLSYEETQFDATARNVLLMEDIEVVVSRGKGFTRWTAVIVMGSVYIAYTSALTKWGLFKKIELAIQSYYNSIQSVL